MGEDHHCHFWLNLTPDGLLPLFHVRIGNEEVGPFSDLNDELANTALIEANNHIMPLDFRTHFPASKRAGISNHRNRLADWISVKERKRIDKYRFFHADRCHTGHSGPKRPLRNLASLSAVGNGGADLLTARPCRT